MTLTLTPRDPRIHVFSVSDGPIKLAHQTYLSQLSAEAEGTSLTEVLGAQIDATYAEVFAVQDVQPMGLRVYLGQAHDIPEEALAADAARLDALSGDVLVLAPRAVEGLESLSPRPELTHIGSYAPAEADNAPRDLPPAAKEPSVVADDPIPQSGLSKTTIGLIVGAALVLAVLIFLL
ncbi:hypothetical protein [Jannaschia donghaensis]|uniref:Uncharacterized protein n=1 Tax=Jannaschia donghaensis TaxID=420998 RepID=A0A0M6YHF2_9RHOB|nr:hypothetical protein [Jannaschia donghaensis]CTQ49781.1 hypothetical protein JDO7802_01798 [Jannaschia donghaensis]